MKARRSSPRVRRRYKVTLGRAVAFTANVSADGLCAELRGQVLPRGTTVEGALQIGGQALPFSGCVAWSMHGDWHLNVHGKMGIRFVRSVPELTRLLATALERAAEAQG